MVRVTFLLISLLALSFADKTTRWEQLPNKNNPPPERALAAVAFIDDNIYAFGGHRDCTGTTIVNNQTSCSNTFYRDLWKYDLDTYEWSEIQNVPADLYERSYTAYSTWENGNSLLFYGGTHYNGTSTNVDFPNLKSYSDFWRYNAHTNTWTLLSNNTGPGVRILAGLAVRGNEAWLFCGVNQFFQSRNDLWKFNLNTGVWQLVIPHNASAVPGPRYEMRFLYNEHLDKFVIYGGDGSATATNTILYTDTWLLDPNTLEYTFVTEGLLPQFHPAAGTYKNVFTWFGGEIREQPEECEDEETEYEGNPVNKQWALSLKVQNRPQYIQVFPAASPQDLKHISHTQDNGLLYLLFGFDFFCPQGEGSGRLVFNNHVWKFDLSDLDI